MRSTLFGKLHLGADYSSLFQTKVTTSMVTANHAHQRIRIAAVSNRWAVESEAEKELQGLTRASRHPRAFRTPVE